MRDKSTLLAEIATLRDLQRAAAEADTARAAVNARTCQNEKAQFEALLLEAQSSWRDAVTASSFVPNLVSLWSSHLLQQVENVTGADAAETKAAGELHGRRAALLAATSLRNAAVAAQRRVQRDEDERLDARRLEDVLDRYPRRIP